MQRIVFWLSAVALVGVPFALAEATDPPVEVDRSPPVICWQSIDPARLPGFENRADAIAGLDTWASTTDGVRFLRLASAVLEVRSATPQVFLFAPAPVDLGLGRTLDSGRALWVTARDTGVGVQGFVLRIDSGDTPGGLSGTLEIESTDLEGRVARVSLPSLEPVSELSPGRFCSRTPRVVVPDVVDLEPARARALLEELELALEIDGDTLEPFAGTAIRIVDQTPAAGEEAPPGSVVRSAVAGFSRVPSVVGRDVEDARQELSRRGLHLRESGPRRAFPGEVAYRVQSQDPEPGSELALGQAVLTEVASFLPVPDLSGMELGRADRELRTKGLLLESDPGEGPYDLMRVLGQRPSPGSLAIEGSSVQADVVRLVRVPSLVGLDPAEARKALARRGLELTGDETLAQYSQDSLFDLVEQKPPDGVEVTPGSSVAVRFEVLVPVPEIRGLSFPEARKLLAASGLQVGAIDWRTGGTLGLLVLSQGQPAKTRVPPGTAIGVVLPKSYEATDISWPWPWAVVVAVLAAGLRLRRLRRPKAKFKVQANADLAGLRQSANPRDEDPSRVQLDVRLRPVFDAGEQTVSIVTQE